ncbi:hypothetical protein SteCoe_32697 [Stentor coeruleus]|uniref:Uncharacterized protein n=1 Tax=Stentor coeruleus TaxID=5963 RepID=A0A1R2AYM5_9CILI|nr:hypothetical protein SteCoe_32697 [Stentor coeruleus]
MDIQSEAESHKFLIIFGPPFRSFCKFMTLKTGVILIATLDIFMGVISFFIMISFLTVILSKDKLEPRQYINSLVFLLDIVAVPFALFALKGINKLSQSPISIYSQYKLIEFVLINLLRFFVTLGKNDVDLLTHILIYIFYLIFRFATLYLIKVIWSADIRLRYNETILVIHGDEALKLMQQQAVNLSDSGSYSSGMQAYISPSYNP